MIGLSKTCGMCAGAKSAYKKTLDLLEHKKTSGRVFLYKKLLHNSDVIKDLLRRGAEYCESLPANWGKDDVIVIRAHGETAAFFDALAQTGMAYRDCTCRKVQKIHALIAQKYADGYTVVIIGDKEHAEVIGSNGWCDNTGIIISSGRDIVRLPRKAKKIFVIAQTTFNEDAFKTLSSAVKARMKDSIVEVCGSLCNAQRLIHDDSAALAARCQTMIVLGSNESANTRELSGKCQKAGAKTVLVENCEKLYTALYHRTGDVPALDLSGTVGLTGGASTPQSTITECKQLLEWTVFYREAYDDIRQRLMLDCKHLRDTNARIDRVTGQFAGIALSPKAKYLRGALIMLGYRIGQAGKRRGRGKGKSGESAELASVYELLEAAILIHDDVFDKAAARRSVPTIHRALAAYYRGAAGKGVVKARLLSDTSEAAAVCAGDIGFYLVNSLILQKFAGHKQLAAVLAAVQRIVITTIKGELLDILLSFEERLGLERGEDIEASVLSIDTMKTAEYTTIGPLSLGMLLAGAEARQTEQLRAFALHLGIAFQIKDDLLDIFGGDEQGKQRGADIAEYKMTLLYAAVCNHDEFKRQLDDYYGKNVSRAELMNVRQIMEAAGAREAAEKRIAAELARCRDLLAKMDFIEDADKELLYGFIIFLELRAR